MMHGQVCSYLNKSSNLNRLNAFHYKVRLNANKPLTGTILGALPLRHLDEH